jgi:hypothetical protein
MREKGPFIHTLSKLAKKQIEYIISVRLQYRIQRFYLHEGSRADDVVIGAKYDSKIRL